MFKKIIDSYYKPVEYPALFDQMETWSKTKPLKGLRVLDASPIFRNTLVKYDALLAAGASLSVGLSKKMPHDELIVKTIKESGLSVYSPEEVPQTWDLVLDCAAQFAFLESKYGFVELTRSGVSIYEKSEKPVFVADSSEIKNRDFSRDWRKLFSSHASTRLFFLGSKKTSCLWEWKSGDGYYHECPFSWYQNECRY